MPLVRMVQSSRRTALSLAPRAANLFRSSSSFGVSICSTMPTCANNPNDAPKSRRDTGGRTRFAPFSQVLQNG